MPRNLEQGVQFTTNLATNYSVQDFVQLSRQSRDLGFDRIWVNENLRYRNIFVILSALASRVKIKIGTAVVVPYFRNPIDLADAIASLTEIAHEDVIIGMARGSTNKPLNIVESQKPVTMLREGSMFVRRLLDGQTVRFSDYPLICSYFHLRPSESTQLSFLPSLPIYLLGGGNSHKSAAVAGQVMDGLLVGTFFKPLLRTRKLDSILAIASQAARETSLDKSLRKVAEIDVSISNDESAGRRFARRHTAHAMVLMSKMGYSREEFSQLGIDLGEVNLIEQSFQRGATLDEAASLVSDKMVDAIFIAGNMDRCKDEILEIRKSAKDYGFEGISFSKLGPDYQESLRLIAKFVL
ncbi:MAG: LLM class flavin-dependent oxidoreductase [Nitrososphaerales archaeon]